MNFNDYTTLALRTESTLLPLKSEVHKLDLDDRTLHSLMGISTEIVEIRLALRKGDVINLKEEIGDAFWYISIIADNLFKTDIITGIINEGCVGRDNRKYFTDEFDELFDQVKKTLFYGKVFDKEKAMDAIVDFTRELLRMLEYHRLDIEECLAINIKKLYVRYPESFNKDDALMRNLEKELEVLKS